MIDRKFSPLIWALFVFVPASAAAQMSKVCVHRASFIEDGFITVFEASESAPEDEDESAVAAGFQVEYSDSSVAVDSSLVEYGDTRAREGGPEVVRGDAGGSESSELDFFRGDEVAGDTELRLGEEAAGTEQSDEPAPERAAGSGMPMPNDFLGALLGDTELAQSVSIQRTQDGFLLSVDGLVLTVRTTPIPASFEDVWTSVTQEPGQGRMRLDTGSEPCVEGRVSKKLDRIELKGRSGKWLQFRMKSPTIVKEPQPRDTVKLATFESPMTLKIR